MAVPSRRRIPEATVARLPLYYRALLEVADQEVGTISSERLAELAGVNAAKVRKDLSLSRLLRHPRRRLRRRVPPARDLAASSASPTTGRSSSSASATSAHALANYRRLRRAGLPRRRAGRRRPRARSGSTVGDLTIEPIDDLADIVAEREIAIGIIATPAPAAQDVADRLVDAGVTSILNFAPAVITVPEGVSLRKVDLAIELQILSFYQHRATPGAPLSGAPPGAGPSAAGDADGREPAPGSRATR